MSDKKKIKITMEVNGEESDVITSITSDDVTEALSYTPMDVSLKGAKSGIAELDENGLVLSSQLPSYVDDTIEGYFNEEVFYNDIEFTTEISPESGKIYVDLITNKTYRWSGTTYVVISETLALGETSSTAYRGDRGKIAYDHSQSDHAPSNAEKNQNAYANISVGDILLKATTVSDTLNFKSGNNITITPNELTNTLELIAHDTTYDLTTDSEAGLFSPDYKKKLDAIDEEANKYVLPAAGESLGGVKSGGDVTITDGVISVNDDSHNHVISNIDGLQTALDGKSGTGHQHYYAGSSSLGGVATSAAKLSNTSAIGSATRPVYFNASGVPVAGTYSLNKTVPSDAVFTDTTYSNFVKSGSGAKAGLVPAPSTTAGTTKYLREDGTWTVPPDTNTDTKNTAGSTDSSSKLFLIGATSQAANPQTYSHDTVYIGTDGCLYSNDKKVSVSGHAHASTIGKTIDGNYKTQFRTQTKGDTVAGNYLSNIRNDTAAVSGSPQFGSGLAFGRGDTHGYLYTNYLDEKAYIGGGNGDRLNWVSEISLSGHTHSYLPLSGGTLASSSFGPLNILRSDSTRAAGIKFSNSNGLLGAIGITGDVDSPLSRWESDLTTQYTIFDTGNAFTTTTPKANGTAAVGSATTLSRSDHVHPLQTTVSGNAGSATKLATARKINGISFNGTSDIYLPSGRRWWVGTSTANTSGWYHFLTITMDNNIDFNMLLSITSEYTNNYCGIFRIHVRNNATGTANKPSPFGWLVRQGWKPDSVIAIVDGVKIDFYIKNDVAQYSGICFTVLSESSLRTSTSYTTVSSTSPTTGLTATVTSKDIGIVGNANTYGTCSTAAATAAKVVTLSGFYLVTGAKITVIFSNGNSADAVTLNVNNTGAKAVYYLGEAMTSRLLKLPKGVGHDFIYDGTNWVYCSQSSYVSQTNSTANSNFRLILSCSADDIQDRGATYKSSKFTANPSTGVLTASIFTSAGTNLLVSGTANFPTCTDEYVPTSVNISLNTIANYSSLIFYIYMEANAATANVTLPIKYLLESTSNYVYIPVTVGQSLYCDSGYIGESTITCHMKIKANSTGLTIYWPTYIGRCVDPLGSYNLNYKIFKI